MRTGMKMKQWLVIQCLDLIEPFNYTCTIPMYLTLTERNPPSSTSNLKKDGGANRSARGLNIAAKYSIHCMTIFKWLHRFPTLLLFIRAWA